MKRLSAVALVACIAMAGCAEDAATIDEDVAAAPVPATDITSTTGPASQPMTTDAAQPAADFGSRYVGSPVAFWFWAPY